MSGRAWVLLAAVALAGGAAWRANLFRVDRSVREARPLALLPDSVHRTVAFDVVLPAVPAGMRRLETGVRPLLVHYWAPWERHGRAQALDLDTLQREPDLGALDVVIVCFDPFPSVARFVGRHRMTTRVLLDGDGALRRQLPCPVLPYTYVVDPSGRVRIEQPGEVEWDSPATRRALRDVLDAPALTPVAGPVRTWEWARKRLASTGSTGLVR